MEESVAGAITTLVSAEAARLGSVNRVVVFGDRSGAEFSDLSWEFEQVDVDTLLEDSGAAAIHADMAVLVSETAYADLETRVLGHALAELPVRAVLAIRPLGAELPVPLIELRRGLMLDAPHLGYRLWGRA